MSRLQNICVKFKRLDGFFDKAKCKNWAEIKRLQYNSRIPNLLEKTETKCAKCDVVL